MNEPTLATALAEAKQAGQAISAVLECWIHYVVENHPGDDTTTCPLCAERR